MRDELTGILKRMGSGHQALGFVTNSILDAVATKRGRDAAEAIEARHLARRPRSLLKHSARELFAVAWASADVLHPDDFERGLWECGYALCEEFFRTPAGKLLLSVVGRRDPTQLFANEPTAYRTVFSWGKRSFRKLGATTMELVHTEDFLPVPLNEGTMTAAMQIIEVPTVKVVGEVTGVDAGRYLVTW